MDYEKKAKHANHAKTTDTSDVTPAYQTLSITNFNDTAEDNATPLISEEDVILARKWVDENHK